MKKRSKLDLAPDVVPAAKSQASGFGTAVPPDSRPEPESSESVRKAANDPRQPRARPGIMVPRNSRALILVSVAVVAAAAVSLFVLKRR